MSWTQPTERQTGDVITAAIWNQDVKDNVQFLHDRVAEMWVESVRGSTPTSFGYWASMKIRMNYTDAAYMKFVVPDDYDSAEEVIVVFIPDTSASVEYDVQTQYGGQGEAYNVHAESLLNQPFIAAAYEMTEVDVSGVLSSMAAGDYVTVVLQGSSSVNACNWHVLGLRFRYKRV